MGVPLWVNVLVVVLGSISVLSCFGYAYIKRMRHHPFPDRKTAAFVFRERWASGVSDKPKPRFKGGASNCLTVAVTRDELWVYGPDIFALTMPRCDLDHRVALGDVVGAVEDARGRVLVEFGLPGGGTRVLTLRVKRAGALVGAIEAGRGRGEAA